jgi:ABC-2 type transport system permease protein
MPPLTADELTFGMAIGGVMRGLMVGVVVALAMSPFVGLQVHSAGYILFHAVAASLMLSLMGTIGGIWSVKFDHIAAVTNFVVTPLAFLSGTFYSIERLPAFARAIAHINPFFYMIDGFRYGFTGHADAPPALGLAVLLAANGALWLLCRWMFQSGYRLKA